MAPEAYIAENKALKADVAALRTEVLRAREEAAVAEASLTKVSHELAQLKRLLFGVKSERFEPVLPDQMALFEAPRAEPERGGTITATATERTRSRPRRPPVRQVLPSHLRREVIVIEPEVDTTGLRRIGCEVTETLDYRPAKLVVVRRERPKYVDPADESRGVILGELPARPIDKAIAEAGLLAQTLIEKYLDHLPLYRQMQRLARQGITIASSTMGGWVAQTADLLVPLYEAMAREARAGAYIQADETGIPVQDGRLKGETHSGYYWVYHAPETGLVVVDYQESRSRAGPLAWLEGYAGALQTDGYAAYDGFARRKEITHYGCWAHARRHVFEAKDSSPEEAEHALTEIQRLYAIERELRESDASAVERRRVRQEKAVPILRAFKTYLEANRGLPKSPWGKAVNYALLRWKKLTAYTEDGRIEIDNNLCENAIRPIALGRRNYLFAGSHDAARRGAIIYSLLGTCKKHGVEPFDWLTDVLTRIPTHPHSRVEELLPHRWKRRG